MTLGFVYWFLLLCWLVFGLVGIYRPYPADRGLLGHALFFFILFFVLGWRVFGFPIQG